MKKTFTILSFCLLAAVQLRAQCNPDTEPPVVSPVGILSVNIMPTGMIALWAPDFMQAPAADNCTPANQLATGVRIAGAGTGFPLDADGNPQQLVVFICCDLGTQLVELWVRDLAGNSSVDTVYVIVQDNVSMCGPCGFEVRSCAYSVWNEPIDDIKWSFAGQHPALPNVEIVQQGACFDIQDAPYGLDFELAPVRDNDPLNGISTFDLVLISKHILAVEPLGNPYKMIAADVNKSRTISTFDVVELRKLILGIYTQLPHNTSWRFIPKTYAFPDSLDPFTSVIPETLAVFSNNDPYITTDFTGIKVGDVNFNALTNAATAAADRSTLPFDISDALLRPDETIRLALCLPEAQELLGFQFALQFDPALLEIMGVTPGAALEGTSLEGHFGFPGPGLLTFSWDNAGLPVATLAGAPVLYLEIRAIQAVHISRALALAAAQLRPELYDKGGAAFDLKLRFVAPPPAGSTEIYPATPNPSGGPVHIPVSLETTATVLLEVYDWRGRQIWRQEQAFPAGLQRWNFRRQF
ncbi:MAG: hypothetical protein IPH12_11795 [Saprospirales bacterium]|nr:hypothetical protein [Saprospirales bacterium]